MVCLLGKGRRRLGHWRDNPRELSALQELAALAAAAGHFVLGCADRLFGAAARFDRHQVAIASGGDETEHAVVLRIELDENDATPWPGKEIDLVGLAEDGA